MNIEPDLHKMLEDEPPHNIRQTPPPVQLGGEETVVTTSPGRSADLPSGDPLLCGPRTPGHSIDWDNLNDHEKTLPPRLSHVRGQDSDEENDFYGRSQVIGEQADDMDGISLQGSEDGEYVEIDYSNLMSIRKPVKEQGVESEEKRVLTRADVSAMEAVTVMDSTVRVKIYEDYKHLRGIMNVPELDQDWHLWCNFNWPPGVKVPEDVAGKKKFREDHPGYATELSLIEQHRLHHLQAAPNIEILNHLYTMMEQFPNMPPEFRAGIIDPQTGTMRCCLDALQLQGDHIAKISMARRENFVNRFNHLREHIEFVRDITNYDQVELRTRLFRKSFLNSLKARVNSLKDGFQDFTGALEASRKMLPMSNPTDQGYVQFNCSFPNCKETLAILGLPWVPTPFSFSHDIRVPYIGGG